MPLVRTLAAPADAEPPKVKGSRFVAHAAPVETEADALGVIEAVRRASPDATHHCWALRLHDGRTRSSDAGEPAGTAGEPILRRIAGADLHGVVVVVARWFGGTKLGTGGLVRAYGEAAASALAAAEVVETRVTAPVTFTFDWAHTGPVQGLLAAWGLEPTDAERAADVTLTVAVPVEDVDAFVAALGERTAGRARVR